MMLCLQCGKEISEGAKFCPYCGAALSAAPAPDPAPTADSSAGRGPYTYGYGAAPSYSAGSYGAASAAPPAPPEKGGKGSKKGLMIGGAVAAVAVVAAVVFMFVSGVFSSPKGQVERAVVKTLAAYTDAGKGMGLPNLSELIQDGSSSQSFRLELDSVNSGLIGYDLSALRGLGLRMSTDCSRKDRRLGSDLSVFWGGNEIVSFLMAVDDNVLRFTSPQFTGEDAYGLDTETLGADLARLGVEDEDIAVEKIGFNLFDLAEETVSSRQGEDMEQALKEANKALADAVKVEKNGKKSIEVNDSSVEASAYRVTAAQEAMEDYLDAVEDAMKLADGQEQSRKLLRAIGLDEKVIRRLMSDMADVDPYGEVFDTLRRALREMGDLELDVYLDGGYVCAVEYAKKQNGRKLEIGLYLGGGDSYVDDLSLRVAVDDEELTVESTGDHGGKDGVFTDKTVLRVRSDGESVLRASLGLRYEPKARDDNFEWTLNVNNAASVEMEGQLTAGKDSMELGLDSIVVRVAGMEICSLTADYSVGPYDGVEVFLPNAKLLGDMDEDDLMDLYYDVEYHAQQWVYDMIDLIPEDLLWALW